MAANGSKSISVTQWDTLKFSWWQISQSIINNTTTVGWELQLVAGANGKIISSVAKPWAVSVNGVAFSGTNSIAIGNNATKTLASGQTTIAHNTDGAKTFSYSFSQGFDINFGGTQIGTKSGSGTGTLNTIPRATKPTLSVSSVDMGASVTISTPGASSSFTHDLAYAFAGQAYVSIATGVAASTTWAVPLSLATHIPNATSGTVTIRCITKNGATVVGTATTLLTAKVPASVVPIINSITFEDAETHIADRFGAFVQHKSAITATISATGASGSTIKSYSATFRGKTYTGASWTSDKVTVAGTQSVVVTVTDSRGRSVRETKSVYILPYTTPQISAFNVARYNTSGEADADGTRLWATYSYSVASLNSKNTAAMKIEYKRSTNSAWSSLLTDTSLSATNTTAKPSVNFSTDYQYDLRLTVTDWFGASATYGATLPSGAVIFDIKADGKGVAFFKTSTRAGVEIEGELPGSVIELAASANLDNLTTPGLYAAASSTIAATISNKPHSDSSPFRVEVQRTGSADQLTQIVQKASKTGGGIYERGRDASGWGAWRLVYAGPSKVLWSGSLMLTANESATLSEAVSLQQSGIVLIFTRYVSGAAADYFYSCHYVPKQLVQLNANAGTTFVMATNKFEAITGKYLYITENKISGNAANNEAGTSNGVTYNNSLFALRFVIGV